MKISQLVKSERNNPELTSQLDIAELLESVEQVDEEYFHNCSLAEISREIIQVLRSQNPIIMENMIPLFCEKLVDFRYIGRVYQLKMGRILRWIPINKLANEWSGESSVEEEPSIKGMLKYGGSLVKVVFSDTGPQLLLRAYHGFMQIKMNEHLIFQRLSDDEKIVMACRNLLEVP
jgi:hypothetical protein